MPSFVLGFALGIVAMLVLLLSLTLLAYIANSQATERRLLMEEQHRSSVVEAAKQAHEKTIAYACHQLR
jgi:hypothetical protein